MKEIEKIGTGITLDIGERINQVGLQERILFNHLISKLNELIEVANSLIKDEEETKPKGKTK